MASNVDGSVVLEVEMDVDDAEKELARLKKRVFKLEDEIGGKATDRSRISSQLVEARKELEKLKAEEPATLVDGQFADNSEYYKRLNEASKKVAELKEQRDKLDQEIEKGNHALEWTKQLYGEIAQMADQLRSEEGTESVNRYVARVRELQASLQEMEKQGLNLGDPGYDKAYSELLRMEEAARDYTREIKQASAYAEEMADGIEISDQHIVDLGKELAELQTRMRDLKRAGIGAGESEYDYIYTRIREINTEIKRYQDRLYAVGEGNYFSDLADSVTVADQRMVDLGRELKRLKTYQKDLERVGGIAGTDQHDEVAARIAEIEREMKAYHKALTDVPEDDPMADLVQNAQIADEYIAGLSRELVELKAQKKDMESHGLGFGVQEYNEVVLRIKQINQELKDYEAALGKVQEDEPFQQLTQDAEVANQHIVDLREELARLKERQNELEGQGLGLGIQEYDDNDKRVAEITKELKEYQKALTDVGEAESGKNAPGGQLTAKLQAAQKMASILGKVSKTLSGSGSIAAEGAAAAEGLAGAAAGMEGLTAAAAAAGPVVAGAVATIVLLRAAVDKFVEESQKLNQSFLAFLKKGGELLKSFSKAAVKAFELTARGAVKLLEKVNVFPKMFSSIGKSLTKLGQMIRRVFVFSVITSGMRMVREQMTAYLNVNAQFSTALRQLKGVLLTAFQPIYNVVVPALTTLMNILARAIAAVTQFTAVLFGTTAKQAQKNAQALYNQSKATSAAGSAAEEASKQLAAFDEINKLEGNKSGGGGVGGGAEDLGPLFDWEYEDTPFPDWGEAFDAFLDKMLGNIPKLKEAFKNFADWLNNLAQKLYDMFTFPGVLDKVKRLGEDLAGAFNDLVNWIDWNLLGKALGAGLNLALNFLTSFLYAFDWMNLGRKLAEFVNGLVSEIDWYEFGRLLWSGFKIGLETLAGFLLGLDMPQLAQAASNIVLGFFGEMKNTIQRIPWGEIGGQIAEFLVNLDWYGMLSAVTSAIGAGLMAAVAAVRGFLDRIIPELDRIAREIVQALIEFFRDKVDWALMAQTIGDGIAAALHFVAQLLDPELLYEIGRAIGDFLINLQWVEIFGGLTEVLGNAINGAIALVKGFLDSVTPEKLREIADGIAQKINEFVEKVDWAELGRVIHDGINAALDFLLRILDQLDWDSIGQAVVDFLSNLDWGGLMEKWGAVVGKAIGGALKAIDLSDAISIGFDLIGGLFQGMINKFNEKGGILGWIKELIFGPFIDGFQSLFGIHSPSTVMAEQGGYITAGLLQGISDAWHTITDFFSEKLGDLKQALIDKWDEMKRSATDKWEEIKGDLGKKWDTITQDAKTKFEETRKKVSEAWANIKTDVPQKWEEIKTALGTAWENVKTAAQEKFGEIKQKIIDKMGELKDHDWKSIGSTIMNGIWDGLKNIWKSITDWAGEAAKWLGNAFNNAKSAVSGIMNGGGSARSVSTYSMPDANAYHIPALAQGAVIPPNREFLAVLDDQHRGNNLEGPESAFEDAVVRGIQRAGGVGGATDVNISFTGSLSELARILQPVIKVEERRRGAQLAEVRG